MQEFRTYAGPVVLLIMLCFLTFVETARANFDHGSGLGMNKIESRSVSFKKSTLKRKSKALRESHTGMGPRQNLLLHVKKNSDSPNSRKRYNRYSSGISNEYHLQKRDYYFTPASPYSEMLNPVDRRMLLVDRGEKGPCHFHACHHGGICVPRRHGFYCECLPGFMGTRCEVKEECGTTTCKHGGTCTEIATGRHICTCPVGYRGENCEERSNCHPNPCVNGGSCSQSEESYTCVCLPEYKGKNCEEINKCSPNPCKNSGVCFEVINDYVCNCPQGFKGKTCEVFSECNSIYCLNGGTCRDEPTGYHCDCRLGFYGKHCEVKRVCSTGLCLNGGTCVDGSYTNSNYGFACICTKDYEGILCEKRLLAADL
ncbi:fibropellin-3-like isoform X1 [Montipora foliosa]|uniref:fibropellin-3-like isoform X1 n=1 Tax=Montipora foliosa TaxID=591990 RepID=UPI0035F12CDD